MVAICLPTNWPSRTTSHLTILYLGTEKKPMVRKEFFDMEYLSDRLSMLKPLFPQHFWVETQSVTRFPQGTPIIPVQHPYIDAIRRTLLEELEGISDWHTWSDAEQEWVLRREIKRFNPHITLDEEEVHLNHPFKVQLLAPKLWWKGTWA